MVPRIKTQIEPLTVAVNVAQAGNVRCDQILLLLGKLFKTYSEACQTNQSAVEHTPPAEDHDLTCILASIELRWAKADQDLHIAAFFLNPCLNMKLINERELSGAVLIGTLHRLYKRMFNVNDVPQDFMENAYQYHQREGIYAAEVWNIGELTSLLKGPVSLYQYKVYTYSLQYLGWSIRSSQALEAFRRVKLTCYACVPGPKLLPQFSICGTIVQLYGQYQDKTTEQNAYPEAS